MSGVARSWGTAKYNATNNGARVGIEVTETLTASQATYKVDFWFWSRWTCGDTVNTWSKGGYVTASGSNFNCTTPLDSSWADDNKKLLSTNTLTVDRLYTGAQDTYQTFTLDGIAIAGDQQLTHRVDWSVPQRAPVAPTAPTGAAVAKNSNTSHTVAWTNTATESGPYASLHVERWDNVSASWYEVASLAGSAASYTDTTTAVDRKYQYRVRAQNATGYSAYATTSTSTTTPAAHTGLGWVKDGADVVLSWSKASTLAVSTEVQESTNGGTSWGSNLATVVAGTNTWRHSAPSTATTHKYRIRPLVDGVAGAWVESTAVQLLAAPLAPTALAPAGGTVDNQAGSTALTWQHNPADGTSQTAYETQHRVNGGSWTSSGKVTSTTASRTISAGTWAQGVTVEWQVRTYGQHASASPWSASATITTGARPVATIQSPAASVDYGQSDLTITWSFYDAESGAQTAALVELLDDASTVLYSATVSGTATSCPVGVALENFTDYSARVTVQDASGLWSAPAAVAFTTDFVPPPAALLSGVWDRDLGKVTLTIDNAGATLPPAWVAAVYNRVWRSIDAGEWVLVADNVPLDTAVDDWTPSTKGDNAYRVETVSATPTSAFSDTLTIATTSPWVFVSGGPGYSTVARLKGGPSVSLSTSREKVLHRFAGRRSPVEFVGAARPRSFKVAGSVDGYGLASGMGTWEAWEAIADLAAPLLYRDPMGRRVYVSIGEVEISHEAPSKYAKVSATLTEVDP